MKGCSAFDYLALTFLALKADCRILLEPSLWPHHWWEGPWVSVHWLISSQWILFVSFFVCFYAKLWTVVDLEKPMVKKRSSKVLRADGRLVNMSGVFCTNNAQAPSLFSNVTLTSRRSYVETVSGNSALLQPNGIYHLTEEGHCCPLPETVSTYDRLLVSVTLEKREGASSVHCLYKKLQPCKKKIWNIKNHGMVCSPPKYQKEAIKPSGSYHNPPPPIFQDLGGGSGNLRFSAWTLSEQEPDAPARCMQ